MVINILEREPCCYIVCIDGLYVLLDNNSIVLETSNTCDINLPIVKDIEFEFCTEGRSLKLNSNNQQRLNTAIVVATAIKDVFKNTQYNFEISTYYTDDIHVFVKNIDVLFGNSSHLYKKITLLRSILNSKCIYLDKPGTLYLRDENSAPIFKFIT
jgi:hypothetical protein